MSGYDHDVMRGYDHDASSGNDHDVTIKYEHDVMRRYDRDVTREYDHNYSERLSKDKIAARQYNRRPGERKRLSMRRLDLKVTNTKLP